MNVQEENNRLRLDIGGMTCSSCVAMIEHALGQHSGVVNVSVNIATNTGQIIYDPDRTGARAIISAIEEVSLFHHMYQQQHNQQQ